MASNILESEIDFQVVEDSDPLTVNVIIRNPVSFIKCSFTIDLKDKWDEYRKRLLEH